MQVTNTAVAPPSLGASSNLRQGSNAPGAVRSATNPYSYPSLLRNPGPAAGAVGPGGAGLPHSLASITQLPTLRTLKPPTLEWLRTFFNDLRPQQRHVGGYAALP